MPGIVLYSGSDKAGANIAGILEREHGIGSLMYDGRILDIKPEDMSFIESALGEGDVCIVASRHRSESGMPSLTTHSPGNYGTAGAGGADGELGYAPALYLCHALKSLQENRIEGYEVCFEATHHGPTALKLPILFVEVGSTEKEWGDLKACGKAAEAIKNLVSDEILDLPVALGFGGGHYCRKLSAVTGYALGHICAKHNLEFLDEKMLAQMIKKTIPRPCYALLEKKGLGTEKSRVLELIKKSSLETVLI